MFTMEEIRDIIIKHGAKIGLERTSDRYPIFNNITFWLAAKYEV